MHTLSGCDFHPQPHGCVELLSLALKAPKPLPSNYPRSPVTIGEHLLKHRMDLELLQREVAVIIGVDECTIHNWERSHTKPQKKYCQVLTQFLGHTPTGNKEY